MQANYTPVLPRPHPRALKRYLLAAQRKPARLVAMTDLLPFGNTAVGHTTELRYNDFENADVSDATQNEGKAMHANLHQLHQLSPVELQLQADLIPAAEPA